LPEVKLSLKVVSPLFLKGPDPRGEPEWRAPSVRGQLRYWLRAIEGGRGASLAKVWERESEVFGGTGSGSVVMVRCSPPQGFAVASARALPHSSQKTFKEDAVAIGERLVLSLSTRPGVPMPAAAMQALSTWLLLGGVGKRSRRMMGALQVVKASESAAGFFWEHQADAESLIVAAQAHFKRLYPQPPAPVRTPEYPTLHPDHSWVLIGRVGSIDAEDANIALFRILRSADFLDDPVFGYVQGSKRRAGPLIAQVREIGEQFVPVLTALRSEHAEAKPLHWNRMNDFMAKAGQEFSAETVHGGPLQ
jgi:CRISPR type III-B/RAMP module RAMP protein Cmr1